MPRLSVSLLGERVAWTIGIACLALWSILSVSGAYGMRSEMEQFAARATLPPKAERQERPDLGLWSPARVHAWRATLNQTARPPLAVLRIPRIGLEVAVLEGTDAWTLNRAVGHIADTPEPGAAGNSGIAGHRDGYFRGLKHVARGDVLELETVDGSRVYRIERTWVVDPDDVSVLDHTTSPAVTLVTCYPFYFIGSAPQRYIVRAVEPERPGGSER